MGLENLKAAGPPPDPRVRREVQRLEEDLGIIDKAEDLATRVLEATVTSSPVQIISDLFSRTNFAIVAAAKETVIRRNFGAAAEGFATEILSGIGPFKGKKESFGDLMSKAGVDRGLGVLPDSLSVTPLIKWAFSDEGRGLSLQRDGFFDWTPRGTLGVVMDIGLDPTTYITLGAGSTARNAVRSGKHYLSKTGKKSLTNEFERLKKIGLEDVEADEVARINIETRIDQGEKALMDRGGIQMFGQSILPGDVISESRPVSTVRDGVNRFLHHTSLGKGTVVIGKGLGTAFNRTFKVRKRPEYVQMEREYIDIKKFQQQNLRDSIEDLFRGTSKEDAEAITKYIDSGGKSPLDERLKNIVERVDGVHNEWAKVEIDLGLLDDTRANYILHQYLEDPETVKTVLKSVRPQVLKPGLRGSQMARTLETLNQAVAAGLTPIFDARELLLRRGLRHIDAVETHKFFKKVADNFGVEALPKDMAAGASGLIAELGKISRLVEKDAKKLLKKGGIPVETIRALSNEGRQEFLRRRFAKAEGSIREMENVFNKYKEFSDQFPETTARSLKETASIFKEPMAEVPNVKEFEGILVPLDMAEHIKSLGQPLVSSPAIRDLLRGYDKLHNAFKASVTIPFPAFHFRNAYSNVAQQFMDVGWTAFDPRNHVDAVRMMAGDRTGSFRSAIGRRWTYQEALYEAQSRQVIADYRNIFETFGDNIPIRTGNRAVEFVKHPLDSVRRAGGLIENEARMTLFTNYLKRGIDPAEAARRVKKVLFDYTDIAPFEREVMTRLIPFYRWTRKNLAFQADRLARNPGAAATIAKITRQQQANPQNLPKFYRGEMAFEMKADEDGKITTIAGIDLPISDINTLGSATQLASMLTPFVKVPGEILADVALFSGRPITEQTRLRAFGDWVDQAPQPVKDWLKFRKRENNRGEIEYHIGRPELLYIVTKGFLLSRAYSTAPKFFTAFGSDEVQAHRARLDIVTGLKLNDVIVSGRARSLEREYQEILEDRAVREGVRKRFQRTFNPDKSKKKKRKRLF